MDAFRLPSGEPVARLGQGTWQIAENRARYAGELAALRLGLDLGLALIDTAEMYGGGRSEELVAEAIAGRRERVYVVSKVLPHNATRRGTIAACERSLKRLRTDYLDLYLLHWRESPPLDETLEAFVTLEQRGSIRHYGVSNFDRSDLRETSELPGGGRIAANQVLYNLERRGVEWDVLPWCREHGVPLMAYSPFGSSGAPLLEHDALGAVAARHAASPARVALAWLLRQPDVVVIPKTSSEAHVRDNHAALELRLTAADLAELDRAFPPPRRAAPLEML